MPCKPSSIVPHTSHSQTVLMHIAPFGNVGTPPPAVHMHIWGSHYQPPDSPYFLIGLEILTKSVCLRSAGIISWHHDDADSLDIDYLDADVG